MGARQACKYIAFIAVTVLFGFSAPLWSRELDLEQAINLALSNNPGIKSQALGPAVAELSIGVARAEFQTFIRPEVGIRVDNGGDADEFYGVRVSRRNVYGTEMSISGRNESGFESGRQNRYTLQVSQPLFRFFGRLVNEEPLVRAQRNRLTNLRAYYEARSGLVVSVVEAYEGVLRLEQQLAADEQSLQRADSQYKLTLARERLGRATRVDTLRAKLQRGQAQSRLNNSREQLGSNRRRLLGLLGEDVGGDKLELKQTGLFTIHVPDLNTAIETALSNRLDYAQVRQSYDDSRRATRIAKRSLLPDLRVVARYQYADESIFFDEDLDASRSAWTVSLQSDTDISRRRENLQYRQSLIAQDQAIETIRSTHLSIRGEVEQRLLAYQRAHAELEVLEGNFDLAAARLRLARKMFRLGRIDGFSVTDAEQAYFTAQSSLLSGRSEASVSGYRMLDSLGTLIEVPDFLKPEGV